MSEAKEYFIKLLGEYTKSGRYVDEDLRFKTSVISEIIESYHQHKIREVLDGFEFEEIYSHIENNCRSEHGDVIMDEQAYYEGAKWLLNHLKTKIKEG